MLVCYVISLNFEEKRLGMKLTKQLCNATELSGSSLQQLTQKSAINIHVHSKRHKL